MATLAQTIGKDVDFLNNVKTIVEIIRNSITALAVIVGAVWAYFKFIKGRTFKPRLDVSVTGRWHVVDGNNFLQCRVTLKNLGASKIAFQQEGTGLRVSTLASDQPAEPDLATWNDNTRVFTIFREHEWIEPGETVSDDVLIKTDIQRQIPVKCEVRLVCRRAMLSTVTVFERQILPADPTISAGGDNPSAK